MAAIPATTRPCRARAALLAVAAVIAATGCSAAPRQTRAGADTASLALAPTTALAVTTTVATTSTTTTTSTVAAVEVTTTTTLAPPAGLVEAVRERLGDPRFAGARVGLSVWVEGAGEVVAEGADVPLLPGSNEKILVAAGALSVIGAETTLVTEVRTDAPQDGSVLRGDLVLVGGGDPTVRSRGSHSLDNLARQLRDRGITEVDGDLVGDESRFDRRRSAPGWRDIHLPTFVGPLSALAVDGNWVRTDAEYVGDPVPGNLGAFRQALERAGIRVTGGDRAGVASPEASAVASLSSVPVSELVAGMLTRSDNFMAEVLLKEVGWRASGRGTTADGLAAAHAAMSELGVQLTGRSADGSGLSRDNSHSAREWRAVLAAARSQSWGDLLVQGLPLAGRSGTLEFRFRGTPADGVVRAKTGSVRESRALSGYLTTAGGSNVVFSLVVNGPTASSALGAMDALVAAMVANPA